MLFKLNNNSIFISCKFNAPLMHKLIATVLFMSKMTLYIVYSVYYLVSQYQMHELLINKVRYLFFFIKKRILKKIKEYTLLRSVHVNKNSQEHFGKINYFKNVTFFSKYNLYLNKKLTFFLMNTLIMNYIISGTAMVTAAQVKGVRRSFLVI